MSKSAEERQHHRYPLKLAVEVTADGRSIPGETVNVSLGGMLVAVPEAVAFGSTVRLKFRIPAVKDAIEVDATVRWLADGKIGVQFVRLRAIEVWGLNQLFKGQGP